MYSQKELIYTFSTGGTETTHGIYTAHLSWCSCPKHVHFQRILILDWHQVDYTNYTLAIMHSFHGGSDNKCKEVKRNCKCEQTTAKLKCIRSNNTVTSLHDRKLKNIDRPPFYPSLLHIPILLTDAHPHLHVQ